MDVEADKKVKHLRRQIRAIERVGGGLGGVALGRLEHQTLRHCVRLAPHLEGEEVGAEVLNHVGSHNREEKVVAEVEGRRGGLGLAHVGRALLQGEKGRGTSEGEGRGV
jgi:hypothetical protein